MTAATLFALLVWIPSIPDLPPVTLGLYASQAQCLSALAATDTSGTAPPIVSRFPVRVACEPLLDEN